MTDQSLSPVDFKEAINKLFEHMEEQPYLAVSERTWEYLEQTGYAEKKTERGLSYLVINNIPEDVFTRLNDQLMKRGQSAYDIKKYRIIKSTRMK